jgi:hypothetical protein
MGCQLRFNTSAGCWRTLWGTVKTPWVSRGVATPIVSNYARAYTYCFGIRATRLRDDPRTWLPLAADETLGSATMGFVETVGQISA